LPSSPRPEESSREHKAAELLARFVLMRAIFHVNDSNLNRSEPVEHLRSHRDGYSTCKALMHSQRAYLRASGKQAGEVSSRINRAANWEFMEATLGRVGRSRRRRKCSAGWKWNEKAKRQGNPRTKTSSCMCTRSEQWRGKSKETIEESHVQAAKTRSEVDW
jgi:hypothetical protein